MGLFDVDFFRMDFVRNDFFLKKEKEKKRKAYLKSMENYDLWANLFIDITCIKNKFKNKIK